MKIDEVRRAIYSMFKQKHIHLLARDGVVEFTNWLCWQALGSKETLLPVAANIKVEGFRFTP